MAHQPAKKILRVKTRHASHKGPTFTIDERRYSSTTYVFVHIHDQ